MVMNASNSGEDFSIGFISVIEVEDLGHCGGYLILNGLGRPIEFHCTVPVKPNRAQEILYGPTLMPFLYGEQIGHTLVGRSTHPPQLICTDVEHVLTMRKMIDVPLVLVEHALPNVERDQGMSESGVARSEIENEPDQRRWIADNAHRNVPEPKSKGLFRFELVGQPVAVPATWSSDHERLSKLFGDDEHAIELVEPFERIREAVEEAQRSARQ